MKSMIFHFLFFCSATIFTQNLEFAGQFYSKSQGQRIIPSSDGNWFFAGKISPGLWEAEAATVIYGLIKNNGDLFPFTPIQDQDDADVVAIFQKTNGNYLVLVNAVDCETFTGTILYEINAAGNVVATMDIPLMTPQNMEIKQYQDNLFVNTKNQILQLFDNGNSIPFINTSSQIQAFIPIYNNLFFVGYQEVDNGFHGLRKLDSQSTVLTTLDLSIFGLIRQMEGLTFDRNVVLQKDRLTLFNDNLGELAAQSLAIVGIEFLRMTVDENGIWVLAKDSNERFFVYAYDYLLNTVQNFAVDLEGKTIEDISIANGKIALVGTENSGTYQDTLYGVSQRVVAGNNFWISTFDKGSPLTFRGTDVSLDNINIGINDFAPKSIGCNNGSLIVSGVSGNFQNIELRITNQGTQVLNYLEANLQIYGCPITPCDLQEATFLNQQYENLNLLPGASTTIPFVDFAANFSDASLPQVCIWLSVPNNQIDQNGADNVDCVYFPSTVAAKEYLPEPLVQIYPNPMEEQLTIHLGSQQKEVIHLFIYDTLGQLVLQENRLLTIDGMTIDTKELEQGLYFLLMTTPRNEVIYSTQLIKK